MSKYPQNTMHAKIMYGWTNRGRTDTDRHTFAPVALTAPKVAAGKNSWAIRFLLVTQIKPASASREVCRTRSSGTGQICMVAPSIADMACLQQACSLARLAAGKPTLQKMAPQCVSGQSLTGRSSHLAQGKKKIISNFLSSPKCTRKLQIRGTDFIRSCQPHFSDSTPVLLSSWIKLFFFPTNW